MSPPSFDRLYVQDDVDLDRLADVLSQYIGLTRDSSSVIYKEEFNRLDSKQKVLVSLATRLAQTELEDTESEWVSPGAISHISRLPLDSAYPALRALEKDGKVENKSGKYRIRPQEYSEVLDQLS